MDQLLLKTFKSWGRLTTEEKTSFRLKQLAKQKLSALGEDASAYELVGVTMKAKSRRGKGKATVIIGQDQETKTVGNLGNDQMLFQVTAPWTYQTLHWDLSNAPGQPDERWQVRFKGNIKVRKYQSRVKLW